MQAQLETYVRRLYSRFPLLGRWIRRRAAQKLTAIGSPDAVQILTKRLTAPIDDDLRDTILQALRGQIDPRCIAAVCAVWEETRHPLLAKVLKERGWVADSPESLRVLSALLVSKSDLLTTTGAGVVEPLLKASNDADPSIATAAQQTLRKLQLEESRDALCRVVMEGDNAFAREAALAAGYTPADPLERVLYHFLVENWTKFEEESSSDQAFVKAYERAADGLRRRAAQIARQANKLAWVDAVVGGREKRRLGSMDAWEWEAVIDLLEKTYQADRLWDLAHNGPAPWAFKIVRAMQRWAWSPPAQPERDLFAHLTNRVEAVTDRGLAAALTYHLGLEDCGRSQLAPCVLSRASETARLAVGPGGRLLVSAGSQGTVWLWQLPQGQRIRTLDNFGSSVRALAVSPECRWLAIGGVNARLELRSLPDGELLAALRGHAAAITALAFSPDGQFLASGSADHSVRVWTLPGGEAVQTLGHSEQVWCLAWASGTHVVTGGKDGLVRQWNAADGKPIRRWSAHAEGITRLALAVDTKVLASGDGVSVRLWNFQDGWPLDAPPEWGSEKATFAVTPDGRLLALGSWNGAVEVWRVKDRRQLLSCREHDKLVSDLAFSADGKLLVSCALDQTIRLWKSKESSAACLPLSQWTQELRGTVHAALQSPETPTDEKEALEFIQLLAGASDSE
jgi:hypothetical protein